MRSATRRGLTAGIALLTALITSLWIAAPAQAHEGVNVTLQTDGSGGVWGIVTYADGHAVTGAITAVMLAVPDGQGERIGPVALRAPEGQQDGVIRYDAKLPAGAWRVSLDVATPGIASCVMDLTVAEAGSAPTPQEKVCAASFWPTASPESPSTGGSSLIIAVIAVAAVLALVALWIALRARRDRSGGAGSRAGRSGGGPSGGGGARRERTGATQGRSRTR